nr:MAG TPA: hypothetical protein [Caudoviricetes sp.]
MTNVYKVSDDGQLIERIATEEVKALAREQLSNAPRGAALPLEEAISLITNSDADECQHVCFSFYEAMRFAKALRKKRIARDAEQAE